MTINLNSEWKLGKLKINNDPLLPSSLRMLIVGASQCGKTYRLFNMLLQPNFLDYNRLFIFSPSIHQAEFQILVHSFKNKLHKEQIIKIFELQKELGIERSRRSN